MPLVDKLPPMVAAPAIPKLSESVVLPVTFNVPPKLVAPVVTVNPLDPVRRPAEVILPAPVVSRLPLVVKFPFSLMVKVGRPDDSI